MAEQGAPEPQTKIEAACHCGQLQVSTLVPTSALSVDLWICHCDTCRHSSGQLAITSLDVKTPLEVTGRAEKYWTSTGPNGLARCFCPTCGTTVYEDSPNQERLGLAGGALTKTDGLVKVAGQIFVDNTKDGGLSVWLPAVKAWGGYFKEKPLAASNYQHGTAPAAGEGAGERLHCKCHCGGVTFDITRPDAGSAKAHMDYTDETRPGDSYANPTDEKWWIREGGRKWAAVLCACNSCRQASGYEMQPWAFVPPGNIVKPGGGNDKPQPIDFTDGTLKSYNSSPDVTRHFCGTCGATVFFRAHDRDEIVDVSVGLAEAPSGAARAEKWFSWLTRRVGWRKYAQNVPLIDMLADGLAAAHREGPWPFKED